MDKEAKRSLKNIIHLTLGIITAINISQKKI